MVRWALPLFGLILTDRLTGFAVVKGRRVLNRHMDSFMQGCEYPHHDPLLYGPVRAFLSIAENCGGVNLFASYCSSEGAFVPAFFTCLLRVLDVETSNPRPIFVRWFVNSVCCCPTSFVAPQKFCESFVAC